MNAINRNPNNRPHSQHFSHRFTTFLFLVCTLLCSCSRTPSAQNGRSNDSPLISTDETRKIGMHVLLNRYPDATIVSEQGVGQLWKYRFATNGTTIPSVLVVDRKAAKARFESLSR